MKTKKLKTRSHLFEMWVLKKVGTQKFLRNNDQKLF